MKAFARNALAAHSGWLLVLGLALPVLPVHAQTLKVIDETYTATAQNTQMSHYRIKPIASVPTNWRMPVDYSGGTVSVHMEVLEKPSDAKTILNICFEGSTKICSPYPPAYTANGTYDFSWPLSMFWHVEMIDWTKGVQNVAVVLKTETEVEAQGDPLFYPAKMHMIVSVTPAGQTVPGASDDDAGATPKDAGAVQPDAGKPDAGVRPDAGPAPADAGAARDAASTQPDAAVTPPTAAGTGSNAAGSGTPSSPAATSGDAGTSHVSDYLTSDSGCSTTAPRAGATRLGWLALGVVWLAATHRRRRNRAL